jgi:hypothetical protein
MALLPPVPARPADRPETWSEYCTRRCLIGLHRQFADDLLAWLNTNPAPPFDPFGWMFRGAPYQPRPRPVNRNGLVARFLASGMSDLFMIDDPPLPPLPLGRFRGYYLSDEGRRRIEASI